MDPCTLQHNGQEFMIIDADGNYISPVDPGSIDGDIDWDLVEEQANKLGYTLY